MDKWRVGIPRNRNSYSRTRPGIDIEIFDETLESSYLPPTLGFEAPSYLQSWSLSPITAFELLPMTIHTSQCDNMIGEGQHLNIEL